LLAANVIEPLTTSAAVSATASGSVIITTTTNRGTSELTAITGRSTISAIRVGAAHVAPLSVDQR
jgi:hypothetical protein